MQLCAPNAGQGVPLAGHCRMGPERRATMETRGRLGRRSLLGRTGAVAGAVSGAGLGLVPGLASIAGAQASGKTITVGMSQEPPTLGYRLGNAYVISIVKAAIGNEPTLTRRNDLNDWVPWLAETVPTLENGGARYVGDGADKRLQVTFTMRKDVKWSDGKAVTAADVKFAWELIMNPDYSVPDRSTQQKVATIDTPDDYTVIANFLSEGEAKEAAANGRGGLPAKAYADFATQSGPVLDPGYYKDYLPAFPKHVLQPLLEKVGAADLPKQDIMRKPLGIGPYKVTEWAEGQFIALAAVPTFFLGAPRTPNLIVKIVTDTNAILAQLATSELDVVTEDALSEFSAPELDKMANQKLIRAYYTPGATWEHIDLNLENEHLGILNVRKAIAHAINRQQLVDKVLNGKTKVIHSWAPEWRWDFSPEIPKYDFNPEKAKALLKEAGYAPGPDGILAKGGKKLSIKYGTTAGNQARLLVTQLVQADLKAVGIEANLDYVPSSEWFAAGDNPGPLWGRTFEMGEYAWVGGDDPLGAKNLYSTGGIPAKDNAYVGQNFPGFKDARNDELLAESENTLDQARRVEVYAEQQKIWAEAVPVVTLYARANVTATKRSLQNFRPTPTNTPPTWNCYDWYLAD